jgi:hypothetical protein
MDIYRSAGGVFLDAAAFSLGDICTLAVGDSGAAKSTLSAAAIAAGERVLSNDSVMLVPGRADAQAPSVHPNRRDAYLMADAAARLLPDLQASLAARSGYLGGKGAFAGSAFRRYSVRTRP